MKCKNRSAREQEEREKITFNDFSSESLIARMFKTAERDENRANAYVKTSKSAIKKKTERDASQLRP
jgi:hypothetical protein